MTWLWPLKEPRTLPERADLDLRSSAGVRVAGGLVIAATVVFVVVFW